MIQAVFQKTFENDQDLKRHLKARDRDRKNLQPKTNTYWQGNENGWNRKRFACDKVYRMYHKINDQQEPLVQQRQEQQDKQEKVESLRAKSLEYRRQRQQDNEILEKRKLERMALQKNSGQLQFDSFKGEARASVVDSSDVRENRARTIMRSGARIFLKKDPPNLWNDFASKSKKLMELYLRPEMLVNEEQSFNTIKKRIMQDIKKQELAKIFRSIEHDVLRHDMTRLKHTAHSRDSKNQSYSQTNHGSKSQERIANAYSFFYRTKQVDFTKERKTASETSRPNQRLTLITLCTSTIRTNSSQTSSRGYLNWTERYHCINQRENRGNTFDVDAYKEFKGMLVRDVNKQTAYLNNPYIEKIKEYSEFAKEREKLKHPNTYRVKLAKKSRSYDKAGNMSKNQLVDMLNSK